MATNSVPEVRFSILDCKEKRSASSFAGTAGAIFLHVKHHAVATHSPSDIVRFAKRMKRIVLILLAGFSLLIASARLSAQSDDPSEVFLKAYMTSQQAEKLEHENQFKAALAKFRFAGSLLEELHKAHTDWQPAIVEYRSRKIGESILRVQSKLSTQQDLSATTEPAAPTSAPVLPQNAGPPEPNVELMAPPAAQVRAEAANNAAIQDTTKRL